MTRFLALALVVTLAACGGKSAPATSTVAHSDEMHAEHRESGLPPEVNAFHDRFAPLYHATPGPERTKNTCDAQLDFDLLLASVDRAGPPADVDAVAWAERIEEVRTAAAELGQDCIENDARGFDAKLEALHDSFHALIELLPHAAK